MRLIAMVIIMLGAFFVTSRLQVNEHARFVTRSGEVIEGRVTRDFMTGDFTIEKSDHSKAYVSHDDFGAMSFEGSAIPLSAGLLGFLLLIVAACVGFGVDELLFEKAVNRKV